MKFKSLKKLYEYFEKRLNNLVNNTSDRVRLPCPYSRVSELILLDRCISLRKKNAVKKLDALYQRHEKLAKQIKQETVDFKAIVARQGRELVSGKVRNAKVLYESEIYLLTMSVNQARIQVENNQKSIEEYESENEKLNYYYVNYCQRPDFSELKDEVRDITKLRTECELIESEISEINSQLGINSDGENDDEMSIQEDSFVDMYNMYNRSAAGSKRLSSYSGRHNGDDNEAKNKDENEIPASNEAKANIASLKTLPFMIHNIFNKIINE